MTKENKIIAFGSIALLLSSSLSHALTPSSTPSNTSCESLGYTVDYDKCIAKGVVPVVCPFANSGSKKVLCMVESCRGYPLSESDLSQTTSDGKTVIDHLGGGFTPQQKDSGGVLGCLAGYTQEGDTLKPVWYYKIKQCKTTSTYQNDICDKGCDRANKYPYTKHPGNFAGTVLNCIDSQGEVFGYKECHNGWNWHNGACELSACDPWDYPYLSNPNIYENRGGTLQCLVGGNTYYRYAENKADGTPVGDVVCGKTNDYQLINSACTKKCHFSSCKKTVRTENLPESLGTFSFNEWSCKQTTAKCRVGDDAVIGGVKVGIITHLPTSSSDKVRIINLSSVSGVWVTGEHKTESSPLPALPGGSMIKDMDGKYNSNFLISYAQEKNKTLEESNYYQYPVFKSMLDFEVSGCSEVCKKGEWYIYAGGEVKQIYDDRQVLYNITRSTQGNTFKYGNFPTSTNFGSIYITQIMFGGSSTGSIYYDGSKNITYSYYPTLSFRLY